jgi:hypothetical protein
MKATGIRTESLIVCSMLVAPVPIDRHPHSAA